MFYFTYGSNVLETRIQHRAPSAQFVGVRKLEDYKLVFNKVSNDGSYKANVVPCAGSVVYGALYFIGRADKVSLNRAEGKMIGHYDQQWIHMDDAQGTARRTFMYVANTAYTADAAGKPYTWYRDVIVKGMETMDIPASYVQNIQRTAALVDLDMVRTFKNLSTVRNDYTALAQFDVPTDDDSTMDAVTLYTAAMLVRQDAINVKYFRMDDAAKCAALETLHAKLNALFNVTINIAFNLDEHMYKLTGGGYYNPSSQTLTMCGLSLMTYVHEYAHALQFSGVNLTQAADVELEAREWSHTVFFIASPHMYLTAKDGRKFAHNSMRLMRPFSNADGSMPSKHQVLKNRFYKYFDVFVAHAKAGLTALDTTAVKAACGGHKSMLKHYNQVVIA